MEDQQILEGFFEIKTKLIEAGAEADVIVSRMEDMKSQVTELWSQVNALKTELSEYKLSTEKQFSEFKGTSTKMDLVWKILVALMTAAALAAVAL